MGSDKTVSRELKPGKTFCIDARVYKASLVKVIKDEKGEEKKEISVSSTRMIPESLIEANKIPDWLFIGGSEKPKPKQAESDKKNK